MIDPSIITRGAEMAQLQQRQNMDALADLGGNLGQLVLGRRINQMQQLKTPEEQQAFANKSIFSPQLNQQLKADRTAATQAEMAKQKHEVDIYNARMQGDERKSNAYKNTTQGQGYGLDNAGKLMQAADRALMVAAQSGDPMAAKLALNNALKAGAINPETFKQYNTQIDVLGTNPEALKRFAQGIAFSNSKDPGSYLFTTADNELDNATTRRGQDIDQTIADNRLTFDYEKTDAENQYKYDALEQDENQFWASFNQKDAQFYSDQDFQLMKSKLEKQQVKNETPEQKMERINNTIGSADAARQAARAAQDAAALINHPGIASGTGMTSLLGVVPGTDAKDFKARLENLKSQVFLPTVKSLQGMGALSNAEGEKIASAVANLDPSLGQEALSKQLTILAQEMSKSAKKAQKQTQNYATRGGTIQLQASRSSQNQGSSKIYTQAMIREYARQSGRSMQEIAQAVRDSGGVIQ